jgi:8-oxo-dGTP diphosphatase
LSAARGDVHVVAGVVRDLAGAVLIAQRPAGRHLAGGWEFPGGKLLPNESRIDGLAREVFEELGIRVTAARPLIRVRHDYPDLSILLDVWMITAYEGSPRGLDGQRLRWCGGESLAQVELLPADRPVVVALRLPERIMQASSPVYDIVEPGLIGGPGPAGERGSIGKLRGAWCEGLTDAARATAAGAAFLVLRHTMLAADLAALCESVNVPVFARGVGLDEAWALGATGINAMQ